MMRRIVGWFDDHLGASRFARSSLDKVVPELQRRGIFRKEYEGPTLRENLGLPRPKNRFFAA